MQLSASTFVAVLLTVAARDATATPQQINESPAAADENTLRIQTAANRDTAPTPIPPEVLAAQQASAEAVASAVAAANSAAAASGLRQPPGLQQADASPTSLSPLPALATGADTAPPAEADSPAAAPPAATPGEPPRQPPGLNADTPVSLAPPPNPPSLVETSAPLETTSDAAQIIGSFTPIVGETSAATGAEASATAGASEGAISSAAEPSTAAAAAGSFTPIGSEMAASGIPSNATGVGVVVEPSTSTAAAAIGSFTTISADTPGDAAESPTSPSLAVPSRSFVFTNASAGVGAIQANPSGIARPTGGLASIPAAPAGAAAPSGSLLVPPGLNRTAGSIQLLPGSPALNASGPLQSLPNADPATATEPATGAGTSLTAPTTPSADSSSALALTTMTTVSDGVTSTLVTAVPAARTDSAALGPGAQAESADDIASSAESGAAGSGGTGSGRLWTAVAGGTVGVLGVLLM